MRCFHLCVLVLTLTKYSVGVEPGDGDDGSQNGGKLSTEPTPQESKSGDTSNRAESIKMLQADDDSPTTPAVAVDKDSATELRPTESEIEKDLSPSRMELGESSSTTKFVGNMESEVEIGTLKSTEFVDTINRETADEGPSRKPVDIAASGLDKMKLVDKIEDEIEQSVRAAERKFYEVSLTPAPIDTIREIEEDASDIAPRFTSTSEIEEIVEEPIEADVPTSSAAPSPSQQARKKSLAEIRSLVELESYCESVYNPEDVEILMQLDDAADRFGANWWKIGGFFFGTQTVNVTRPMCSTYPRLRSFILSRKISEHEFFQRQKIDIPLRIGLHGFRLVEFHHLRRDPSERVILECRCEILEGGAETNAANICIHGRVVSLSRGVGGNQSFFVYALNTQTTRFNAIAHICF